MTTNQFILFAALLILPSLYQRSKFALKRHMFLVTKLRDKSGLQIHHAHWGLLILLVTSIALAFGYHGWWTIIGIGYSWGLILDEIVPALKMPTVGRDIELDIYAKSLKPTIIVIAIVVVAVILAYFFASPHVANQFLPDYIG